MHHCIRTATRAHCARVAVLALLAGGGWGDAENARPENDGQKLRGLENAGLENEGQTCGHSRFCARCADAVAVMPNGCPLCRTPTDMVMRVYF